MDIETRLKACLADTDHAEAVRLYTQGLDMLPSNAETTKLLLGRAHSLMKLERYREAEADCRKVLRLDPSDKVARRRLACSLFYQQQLSEASDILFGATAPSNARDTFQNLRILLSALEEEGFGADDQRRPPDGREAVGTGVVLAPDDTVKGTSWIYRTPPRGFGGQNDFVLCRDVAENRPCRLAERCICAHSVAELEEWKKRFEEERELAVKEHESKQSISQTILEKWYKATNPEDVLTECRDDVTLDCDTELSISISKKPSETKWTFSSTISSSKIQQIALIHDEWREHFTITCVKVDGKQCQLDSEQEWSADTGGQHFSVTVKFATSIFGTFRQQIVFVFENGPALMRQLCVDVAPVSELKRLRRTEEALLAGTERWDKTNVTVVEYDSKPFPHMERELSLMSSYPSPQPNTFKLTQSVFENKLTQDNYRSRQHELLYVEELEHFLQIGRYNLNAKLAVVDSYLLMAGSTGGSSAKYAQNGELFAQLELSTEVSEDSVAGRMILNNCSTVLVTPSEFNKSLTNVPRLQTGCQKLVVYEALLEDKTKRSVYLRLSSQTVSDLKLQTNTYLHAEVQFQLNRLPLCEMHFAVDRVEGLNILFPKLEDIPSIPWTPQKQWSDCLDSRLNPKQREAVVAITTPLEIHLPPILIIGPFGTGKTYTLAQAMKQLLCNPVNRILICTHSNSAADLYIKEYLHPYIQSGHPEARPLRIYYHKRWVSTVNPVVQEYCLIESTPSLRFFRPPTADDLESHRVVVATLSTSQQLSYLGLAKGFFTHILLDEAAQAMECEVLMPLALADQNTRIVLAGDHMQLSPEVCSAFARERNLHMSLLERLFDYYPCNCPCKIMLCENYRSHEAIVQYTSELFYDNKLVSSGQQPSHEDFYPLTFFTARGDDRQDTTSTAFYNDSEVYEIVERVVELCRTWPMSWGSSNGESSIGIVTPYSDQVVRIRSALRKRKLGFISVERVLNVQGKQFRAIFLSTVRTRRTCNSTGPKSSSSEVEDDLDYGFLSNARLLNTAITRAQSLVAVVGDPVALCSVGKCRKLWERFIELCNLNKSMYGLSLPALKIQLRNLEHGTYVLNPLAPEFIPRNNLYQFHQWPYHPFQYNSWPVENSMPMYPNFMWQQWHHQMLIQQQMQQYMAMSAVQPWFRHPYPTSLYHFGVRNGNDGPGLIGPTPYHAMMGHNPMRFQAPYKPLIPGQNWSGVSTNNGMQANRRASQTRGASRTTTSAPALPSGFQFRQNVHFPEPKPASALSRPQTLPKLANGNVVSELSLLPKDVDIKTLLNDSYHQLQWYNELLTTEGKGAALKFLELMNAAKHEKEEPTSPSDESLRTPDVVRKLDELLSEKTSTTSSSGSNSNNSLPYSNGSSLSYAGALRSQPQ